MAEGGLEIAAATPYVGDVPRIVDLCALVFAACAAPETGGTPASSTRTPPGWAAASAAGHDWTRFNVDEGRSGVSDAPTGITAAVLPSMRRQQVPLDGTVDASAIYLHDVQVGGAGHDAIFVTTSYGKTLAIDANDGTILWRFTPPRYADWAGSSQITNATPVADPDRRSIYAAAPDGNIRKLAVADGHAVWTTAITTLPRREKIASALNFSRGRVIAATGGYVGDAPPYQGHVAVIDAATGRLLHVWNSLCSDRAGLLDPAGCSESGSAIWGRAGAVIDASGNIFVATGNGRWDGRTNWGDAVLELDRDATRLIANYTPENTQLLDESDADLGSTSPTILDATHVAQGGKDGRIRLLDLRRVAGAAPHRGGEAEVQSIATAVVPRFTAPAVLHRSDAVWLFVADGGGTAAWTMRGGRLTPSWSNGNAGTSPVLAGGLLFVYDPGGTLRVYEPESGREVNTLVCGSGHWNSPIVADGRIILPEGSANAHSTTGVLAIWRLP